MRSILSSSSSFLVLALVACGGSVGSSDPSSNPSTDDKTHPPDITDPKTGGELPLEGSYDLSFQQVDVNALYGATLPASMPPPSRTVHARLDLGQTKGGASARLTGKWGQPGTFQATITSTTVTLEGSAFIGNGTGVSDQWTKLVLERGASGGLSGKVTSALGTQTISQGDQLWEAALTGFATIAKDTTKPELRIQSAYSVGPLSQPLPWDRFTVRASEPVWPTEMQEQSRVSGLDGDSLQARWEPADLPDAPLDVQTVSVTGTVDDWMRAGSGEPWTLRNEGSLVKDLVGLTAAPVTTALPFTRIGYPTTEVGFDDDILAVNPWGPYSFRQTDSRCENGGCLELGPTQLDSCKPQRIGFAGQLTRGPTGHVELRYRVLAKAKSIYADLVTLELAAKGGAILDTVDRPDLGALPAAIGGYAYGSDWKTLDVAAPVGAGEIGYAVVTSSPYALNGGCGGPPPPESPALVVLVESVKSR